jgi:hypothetical protein
LTKKRKPRKPRDLKGRNWNECRSYVEADSYYWHADIEWREVASVAELRAIAKWVTQLADWAEAREVKPPASGVSLGGSRERAQAD